MHTPIDNKAGMALIITLMLFAVLSVITLWALKIAELNQKTARNQVRRQQALNLAEAGIEYAIAAIRENPLWQTDTPPIVPPGSGRIRVGGIFGSYCVRVYDGRTYGGGRRDPNLCGGELRLFSEGRIAESYQVVSCIVRQSPSVTHTADSPPIAVVAAGKIMVMGGAAAAFGYDELGRPLPEMIAPHASLPRVNRTALKAMADLVLDVLDNSAYDASLSHRNRFWRNAPADTRPYITWVKGDLLISENKRLFGVFLVEGDRVMLSENASLCGVLFAPNACQVILPSGETPGAAVVMGQIVSGGHVKSNGNAMSVQLVRAYVDGFNDVGSSQIDVNVLPGSWHICGDPE